MSNPAPTETLTQPDVWELVNDDGFIYKRRKRRLDPNSFAPPPDPAPDPSLELKERAQRKRAALLKLKNKYAQEILQWEHLSNTFKAMFEKSNNLMLEYNKDVEVRNVGLEFDSTEDFDGSMLNEVLKQVEAQEAMISDLEGLCDIAESLCNVQEEKAKHRFLDLPIWSSPRELMASLCED